MEMVHVLDHPLLQHKLSILRDETTGVKDFREIVCEIATLMCYDATRNLPLQAVEVQTPVAKAVTYQLAGKKLAIVPVLRAGLGMVEGILTLIPSAKVGHIGLFRDPDTLEPVKYYCKMPTDIADRDVIILDPMLATGGSASAAISFVKEYGVKNIKLMNILAAPEGIARVRKDHPDVEIYVAAVDDQLNDHGYIVPGLGDAGDRIFGTKKGSDSLSPPRAGPVRPGRKTFSKKSEKSRKNPLTAAHPYGIISLALNETRNSDRANNARVVELADSLDSGYSVQYARAGSSPASRTKQP